MKSFYIVIMASAMFFFTNCKQDAAQVQEGTAQQAGAEQATSAQEGSTPQQPATSTNTPPANVSQGHDYTYLTDQLFIYKAAFGGQKDQSLYKDNWIDLESDGTFKAGKLKQQTHTGKWGYNHDVKVLQLIPDDTNFPRSEWKVMHNEQMMVWVGTQTYGNNNTQIQLVKSKTLPE
jgi:hypothetical protein